MALTDSEGGTHEEALAYLRAGRPVKRIYCVVRLHSAYKHSLIGVDFELPYSAKFPCRWYVLRGSIPWGPGYTSSISLFSNWGDVEAKYLSNYWHAVAHQHHKFAIDGESKAP